MTSPFETSPFRATTDDGALLRGDWLVPPRPVAVAITLHAMMVSRRTMDRPAGKGLASALAEGGLAVANVDLRAHGESGPRTLEGAVATYDDFVVHDIPAIIGTARAAFPGLPVAVVGHSLGGHATLILSGLLPARAPDALVMLASNIWMRRTDPSALRRTQKWAVFTAWHALTAAFGVFDAPRLGVGTDAEPRALVEQFVTFYREDRLTSRDGTLDYEAALLRSRIPVLTVSSEGDRLLAHPVVVRKFVDLAPNTRATHRVIRHGELGLRAPGHMGVVTEAACRPVWDDIARWIRATLAPGEVA